MTGPNISFIRSLGQAVLALSASALVVLCVYVVHIEQHKPEGSGAPEQKTILGKQLNTQAGTTHVEEDTLWITELVNPADQSLAVASLRSLFKAESYSYLRYEVTGLHPGLQPYFVWQKASTPGEIFSIPLPVTGLQAATFQLTGLENWQGTIIEAGILLSGEMRGQPIGIHAIALSPYTWKNAVAYLWSEWTAYRGWSAKSINYLQGRPDLPGSDVLSPTPVFAAWSALALFFLLGYGRVRKPLPAVSYGAAILIPWIALDLLWQNEFNAQLEETEYLFSGKSAHEKHLVDVDRDIYSYAKRLKEEVLPAAASRIFILHDSSGHNYERLKTQHYLLPHNIYNYGRFPPARHIRPGDYLLILGEIHGLRYRKGKGRLVWGKKRRLSVALIDQDTNGRLFKVTDAPLRSTKKAGTSP